MTVDLQSRASLAADLRALGVEPGGTVLVHASLRSLGYVLGGATTVVHALLDTVGGHGTIVAPAYTPENRDPSRWTDPPMPEHLWTRIRAEVPPYDAVLTPSAGVGAVAERVRTWPGAVRSGHPQTSFAAVGPAAVELTAGHALDSPLGEHSPLARLAETGAYALLLGVGFERCSSFHLAEYRLPDPPRRPHGCAMTTSAGREWITFDSVALDAGDFAELGAAFEAGTAEVRRGWVGAAQAILVPIPEAAQFARSWLLEHRPRPMP